MRTTHTPLAVRPGVTSYQLNVGGTSRSRTLLQPGPKRPSPEVGPTGSLPVRCPGKTTPRPLGSPMPCVTDTGTDKRNPVPSQTVGERK